ncbi:MAG: polysaccharide pyruvyl transferase family protein [Cellulomonas sp.]
MTSEAVEPIESSASVGLLFDSISENTGDIAIGIAGVQEFARHGIRRCSILDPFEPCPSNVDLVVVGGGELIRPVGDPFYDRFRPPIASVLNAAGVWQSAADLDYLRAYDRVTARTSTEAGFLRGSVPDVGVLPCTTSTLESENYTIPGSEPGEVLVGIHVVPHTLSICPDIVAMIDAIPERKVFIPFTHYNFDESFMSALPFDRSKSIQLPRLTPLELHSVIGQMKYVVVSSLHASIFAYSQNVPFASASQEKVAHYFADRGLSDLVFASDAELASALAQINEGTVDFSEQVASDKAAVRAAYANYAALARTRHASPVRHAEVVPNRGSVASRSSELQATALLVEQRAHVIVSRDTVIAQLARRAHEAEVGVMTWHAEADHLAEEVSELRAAAARAAQSMSRPVFWRRWTRVIGRRLRRNEASSCADS